MKLKCKQFRKVWLLLVLLAAYSAVYGQVVITGMVTSAEDNLGMPGVYVTIKGTTQGVVADIDGNYNISVRSPEDILVFSYVGYSTQEVLVGSQQTINVVMQLEIKELEVVVMGYSTKKRSEITSAVTTVSSEKLMDVTSNDIGTLLQGKVSGVQVINSSGAPNQLGIFLLLESTVYYQCRYYTSVWLSDVKCIIL